MVLNDFLCVQLRLTDLWQDTGYITQKNVARYRIHNTDVARYRIHYTPATTNPTHLPLITPHTCHQSSYTCQHSLHAPATTHSTPVSTRPTPVSTRPTSATTHPTPATTHLTQLILHLLNSPNTCYNQGCGVGVGESHVLRWSQSRFLRYNGVGVAF